MWPQNFSCPIQIRKPSSNCSGAVATAPELQSDLAGVRPGAHIQASFGCPQSCLCQIQFPLPTNFISLRTTRVIPPPPAASSIRKFKILNHARQNAFCARFRFFKRTRRSWHQCKVVLLFHVSLFRNYRWESLSADSARRFFTESRVIYCEFFTRCNIT